MKRKELNIDQYLVNTFEERLTRLRNKVCTLMNIAQLYGYGEKLDHEPHISLSMDKHGDCCVSIFAQNLPLKEEWQSDNGLKTVYTYKSPHLIGALSLAETALEDCHKELRLKIYEQNKKQTFNIEEQC